MQRRHFAGVSAATGCMMAFVLFGVVLADNEDSPREDHRAVVVGLPAGSTAAVSATTSSNSIRVETNVIGPRVGAPARNTKGEALTPPGPVPSAANSGQTVLPGTSTTGWTRTDSSPGIDTGAVPRGMVQELQLPDITIRTNPTLGVVAIPTWYWVDGYGGETLSDTRTVSEQHQECRDVEVPGPDDGPAIPIRECRMVTDSTTVSVRVQPVSYTWSFGDGTDEQMSGSDGLGTAFRGVDWPSTIQHTYQYSSYGYASGFQIQVTVTFRPAFQVNGGGWHELGDLNKTYENTLVVRQIEPLRLTLDSLPTFPAR